MMLTGAFPHHGALQVGWGESQQGMESLSTDTHAHTHMHTHSQHITPTRIKHVQTRVWTHVCPPVKSTCALTQTHPKDLLLEGRHLLSYFHCLSPRLCWLLGNRKAPSPGGGL